MAAPTRRPGFLREVELRLLRCTLPSPPSTSPPTPPPSPAHPLGAAAASALAAVEDGDYEAALAAAASHLLPASASSGPPDSAAQFYADLAAAAQAFLRGDGDVEAVGEGFECRCAVVLSAAVAALLAFTQQNVTGPPKKFSTFPCWTSSLDEGCYSNIGGIWDAWASANLASFGSHVHGKFSLLQFIVFAELLLTSIWNLDISDCWSVSWWLFRISMLLQNILDELSSSLFDQVQVYKNKMLGYFGELEKVSTYWDSLLFDGEGSYFVSAAFLEAGIVEYKYGRVDASRLHLDSAQEACDLQLSLTGILGFRTIHQVDAKSQMVLVAKTNKSGSDEGQATEPTVALNDNAALKNTRSSVPVESDEFCVILRTPRLLHDGSNSASENKTGPSANIPLSAIQQAAVVAQCLHVSRRSRSDEMSGWEMAPYIESIDSQGESYFVVLF
ncbi:tetratricopeptide repeat protein 27 homolog isoform X2 [Panicum virgatum]|uniref:tetratricopeptide repeat protein 27 homolog isoform X2 n=1 Tax=Panicum virgatum TaxID=38727 RepID=UPI0019D67969|nr:tetratricopeptide repeat protein 27 homolog isoform X2 [Panicum virgatum]